MPLCCPSTPVHLEDASVTKKERGVFRSPRPVSDSEGEIGISGLQWQSSTTNEHAGDSVASQTNEHHGFLPLHPNDGTRRSTMAPSGSNCHAISDDFTAFPASLDNNRLLKLPNSNVLTLKMRPTFLHVDDRPKSHSDQSQDKKEKMTSYAETPLKLPPLQPVTSDSQSSIRTPAGLHCPHEIASFPPPIEEACFYEVDGGMQRYPSCIMFPIFL
jgi:hypothetical protein